MISINLDRGEEPQFLPGDKISGNVEWVELSEDSDKLEVRLIWFTVGKGDRDAHFVDVKEVADPANNGQTNFEFIAPHRPNSFSGKLIAIQWAIEVIVFPQRDAEQANLSIQPAAGEIVLTPVKDEEVFWKEFSFGKRRNGGIASLRDKRTSDS